MSSSLSLETPMKTQNFMKIPPPKWDHKILNASKVRAQQHWQQNQQQDLPSADFPPASSVSSVVDAGTFYQQRQRNQGPHSISSISAFSSHSPSIFRKSLEDPVGHGDEYGSASASASTNFPTAMYPSSLPDYYQHLHQHHQPQMGPSVPFDPQTAQYNGQSFPNNSIPSKINCKMSPWITQWFI